jgi:hypothetical protein
MSDIYLKVVKTEGGVETNELIPLKDLNKSMDDKAKNGILPPYYYIVKNVSASDKTAADIVIESGTLGVDNYDLLEYNAPYTFDGTEDYNHQLLNSEKEICKVSPAFWDLVGELNNPATHMAAHNKIRPFEQNDKDFCDYLDDDLCIHLRYVITATDAERHAWYDGGLSPLVVSLSVGDIAAAADFLGAQTGAGLAAAFGKGTAAQWDQLLTHVTMMATPYLEKFPR